MIAASPRAGLARIFPLIELMKPRLTALAVMAALLGFLMAGRGPVDVFGAVIVLVGAFLVGGGANALNQYLERELDVLMQRTRHRPLPSARVTPPQARIFGAACCLLGLAVLALGAHPTGAVFASATVVLYLLIYTPMKRVSSWNTAVGAIPGALPVLIGWGASGQSLSAGAWSLFAIIVVWQLPHFFAICRLWRDDYTRAGYAMWPLTDASGRRTGLASAALAAALIPLSMLPTSTDLTGQAYALVAAALSTAFAISAATMALRPGWRSERLTFLASIAYLPLLMIAMLLDKA